MEKKDIQKMISEIEKENSLFSKKANLDTLSFPPKIIGRQDKAKELIRLLLSHRQGFVVPYVSVYGRSGCGKSTVVRYVCQNIDGMEFCFVNLRRAKTVFGCANLILAELGKQNLKSAQGINLAVDEIGKTISETLDKTKKNLFVLILDELDVLFYDKRGRPSDFIYKLITLEEKLKETNQLMCVIGITNNVLSEYDLDERVRSRIGSSEIFFEAYSKKDVLSILQNRAKNSFAKHVDDSVLEYCAKISSLEHGDARRAIDLLRVGAEIASLKNEPLSITHMDEASLNLQKDRVQQILSTGSFHFKLVASALARVTFLSDEDWHATSSIFKQYGMILNKDEKPLGYRRVSEILVDLANTGIALSNTGS
jgi:cell division control protein 6